ncbi:MAG: ADP-ribosylglycohydrolase family protein [Actinobacteria bacterium]|nr:ADP-ribosylglycohydrolase family protein [Actinomycetota bacterium]MCG2819897.1 ADP-ribosylglycohydrolase family protein [Actinomycetes bacterium]MBU4179711.1 ADP-ribosylglycohydrolase family protein [Actinomycetota bacterium]MBU4218030.1 ADP-ribosylglycohydrolase family protein [Actinomycetota bacterium]MBU4358887.1 ADP-ribosylglycohydrolase family protein [Actinomycetota bacterium]
MLGAIAGDMIGSIYEWNNIKTTRFPLFGTGCVFTDDTVLTVSVADCILNGTGYAEKFKEYYARYPGAGYGGMFHQWASSSDMGPYNSWGNGSAMRVSPVGFAYSTLEEVLREAKRSAAATHDHPEGIKGAQATASAIFLSRSGNSKTEVKEYLETRFDYDLGKSLDEIRPNYTFDVSCQGSVPQAITAFLEADGFEDAIRLAISIGGDSDTIACITGGIAQAFYGGVPYVIARQALDLLDNDLRSVIIKFMDKYTPLDT